MFKKDFFALWAGGSLPFRSQKLNKFRPYLKKQAQVFKTSLLWLLLTLLIFLRFWGDQRSKTKNHLLRKTGTVLVLFLLFFITASEVSVNANFKESVIPAAKSVVFKINDSIQADTTIHFSAPVRGYISTYFSSHHQGIDIPGPYGTPIKAASDGVITYASWSSLGYGNCVIIRHKMGFETLYAHLSKILVKVGDKVSEGSTIGLIGATGDATGNHLHLEIHLRNLPVNPLLYLDPR